MKKLNYLSVLLLSVILLATVPLAFAGESTLDTVLKRGKVIVGVTSESPPFGFISDQGELVGFDIDITIYPTPPTPYAPPIPRALVKNRKWLSKGTFFFL